MSDFITLFEDQSENGTSDAVQWSAGHGNVFITGTFGHVHTYITIEASVNGTDFAPLDGFDEITSPTVKYFHLTGHSYIRAVLGDEHQSHPSSISVRLM